MVYMKSTTTSYVRVSRAEYKKLKDLEKHFARFWSYFEHLNDIRTARKGITKRHAISQEKLFAELGI